MEKKRGISKIGLIALVVSSSIGSGIFGITNDLAMSAAPGPAIIAWIIVGIGILALVLSLNNLGAKRPDLDGGIFGYAEAAFGKLGGFISGWGYWLSAWLGNVAFATMLMSAIGEFIPAFKGGQNIPSILLASVFIWVLTFLVNNGIESASFINTIVTICKLVPLFLFMVIALVSFHVDIFSADFWGNVSSSLQSGASVSLWSQIKGCLMVMMWVFVGIEGASVLANRAEKRSDAQKASVIGLLSLLVIYVLASLLPYGVMSQAELMALPQPAMANILRYMVGEWGAAFINIGLIISIIGCWLSWTMLPVTNVFLLTFLVTDYAYQFAYSMCTAAILICYLLVGIYQMIYSYQQKDNKQLFIGAVATAFQIIGITLAGFAYVLLCSIAYLPGFYFYLRACKENNYQISDRQKMVMAVVSLAAVLSIVAIATGMISV